MKSATYQQLLKISEDNRAGFILLLDPDKLPLDRLQKRIDHAVAAGVDAFFVGGSLLHGQDFDRIVLELKKTAADRPVIIFPGSLFQISRHADAILFLSLISGRNPEYLIGSQAAAAPIIQKMGLETISCGYMLIESGAITSVQYISNSLPIPRDKPELALAHALAGQFLGMKSIYLEAGSGAKQSVPETTISLLRKNLRIPLLVGGGIRTPEEARQKARAGADFVVIGNFFEEDGNHARMREFADAIHGA